MNRDLQDESNQFEAHLDGVESDLDATRIHLLATHEELHDLKRRHLELRHHLVQEAVRVVHNFKTDLPMFPENQRAMLDELIVELRKELNDDGVSPS